MLAGRADAWERPYDPKLPRWLHRITMPTLLVWGGKDNILPVAQAKSWSELLPNVETQILADRGHLILEETPEAFGLISEFLEG
jgi:pimeloyl-ACP methyl ester carboxylesterase